MLKTEVWSVSGVNSMKPLLGSQLPSFLKRFDDFKEAEIRSLEILSPSVISIELLAQDKARDFDWISVQLLFEDVRDANIPQKATITYLNMDDGIKIIKEEELYAFCLGNYTTIRAAKASQLYIVCTKIKQSEGAF